MERIRKTSNLVTDFVKSYRYFLITLVVLIFLPYSIRFQESFATTELGIAGLFYYLNIGNGQVGFQIFAYNTLPQILNIVIITSTCLYFTFYRKRAERTGTDYSLKIAGVYFALVIITLLIVDWNGMMAMMFFETISLSMFGLLLAYLTIVIPVFQKLSNKKIIPIISENTNKHLKHIYLNIGSVFGFVTLLAPTVLVFSFNTIDINSSNIAVSWMGATYMLGWSTSLTDFSFSFILGLQPQFICYILFWAPQIVLAIQVLRYLSNQTSKRLLCVGFLISLLQWVIFFPTMFLPILYGGGLSSILLPIPILQLLSILILRVERSDAISDELEIEPPKDDMVKVPIRYVLLSRIRKRRNSDW